MLFKIGQACNFIRKWVQHRCFPVDIAEIFEMNFFYKTPLVVVSDRLTLAVWKSSEKKGLKRRFMLFLQVSFLQKSKPSNGSVVNGYVY